MSVSEYFRVLVFECMLCACWRTSVWICTRMPTSLSLRLFKGYVIVFYPNANMA